MALLRLAMLGLAWLVLAPLPAYASDCGGAGQRACCVLEASFGACAGSTTEVNGCSGDCTCFGGNILNLQSNSHCVQAPACGGEGQRACCFLENTSIGACGDGTTEVNGCPGGAAHCLCGGEANPFSIQSNSRCERASACGGENQRACCLGEAAFCQAGLAEIPGCSGDCFCGGEANPFSIDASGTCIKPTPCGGKGQRACVVFERSEGACDAGLSEIPRCIGDCFGKGLGSAYGVASGVCSVAETIDEPTTNRADPPPDAPTTASSTCPLYGYADMHLHLFADLAHGGGVLAGKPYDENGGINVALQQCAGSNLDFVTQDLATHAETTVADPGGTCPTSFYPDGCGSRIFHGGHDVFENDAVGSPLATRDGALEGLLGENSNLGAPLFNGWPRWTTTTHQQAYYKWLERAWQGGLRLTTMLAVTNEALCKGGKHLRGTNCEDSMQSIDDQIAEAKKFETFIDEQYGTDAQNKGWFRIVYTPAEARQAIAAGKLAVVLGIETAELFNCKFPIEQCVVVADGTVARTVVCPSSEGFTASGPHTTPNDTNPATPMCTPDFVTQQVQKYHDMGVRHVFPIHNFDNGFGGAATWQDAIEVGNRLVEKHWWFTETCPQDPSSYGFELDFFTQLFISLLKFGSVIKEPAIHLSSGPSCNSHGLFSLGQTLIAALMDKGMLIDVDHMSRHAFDKTLDMAEARSYPGIVASHVLSFDLHDEEVRHERMRTKTQLQRIKNVGGMIAAMLKDEVQDTAKRGEKQTLDYASSNVTNDCRHSSKSFAQALEYAVDVMGGPVAMGSDFNGVAGHFGPRFGSDACGGFTDHADLAGRDKERSAQYRANNRLQYPFTVPGFGNFQKQVTGQRTFDYNVDGLAHVGLLPDFVADLKTIGVADSDLNMLFRSAEGYIHVWEGARKVGLGEVPATNQPGCVSVTGFSVFPPQPVDNSLLFFTATGVTPGAAVTWDFGDGSTGSGTSPTHQYADPGTYTITISATDPLLGGSAQHQGPLVVGSSNNTLFGAQIAINSPQQVFEGDSVLIHFTHSVLWAFEAADCGGVAPQFIGNPFAFLSTQGDMRCVYPAGPTRNAEIEVTVVKKDILGNIVGRSRHSQPILILARAPSIVAGNATIPWADAGGALTTFGLPLLLSDVPGTQLHLTVNWGDGSALDSFSGLPPGSRSVSHTYLRPTPVGQPYTVELRLSDSSMTVTRVITVEVVGPPPFLDLSGPDLSSVGRVERYSFFGNDPDGGTVTLAQHSCGPAGEVVSVPDTVQADGVYSLECRFTVASPSNPVSVTYRDDEGRKTVALRFVRIGTPPVVSVPDPITREATSGLGAAVSFDASATDDVDGALVPSCTHASGSTFPLGPPTTVTCSATDAEGNTGSASFTVSVVDTTPPEIAVSVSPQANAAGWHKDPATIEWTRSDLVGVATSTECDTVTLAEETGGTVVTCSAADAAGNSASKSVTVRLDRTAPAVVFGTASPAANLNGWHKSDVTLPFMISDGGSGVEASSGALAFSAEGKQLTQAVTVVDIAGNEASETSPAINLDKTPPSIVGSRSPDANVDGWNNQHVTVSFSCEDSLSGVLACSPATTLTAEGASQSRTGTAQDLAGNEASASVGGINIDLTPPSIASSRDRAPNANDWYNSDVTVQFTCADALSGVLSCTAPQTIANEGTNRSAAGLARDLAGNEATQIEAGINLDRTPPTIAGARDRAPNANDWYNASVTVSFTCGDALSGVGTCGPTPQIVSEEGQNLSRSAAVTDLAGNTATATVGGINLDKTAPVVTCSNSAPTLWPPNHKLVPVQTTVTVSDGLSSASGFTLIGVTSNEPDNGLGDGDTSNDIQNFTLGTPDTSGQLRAERSGAGAGRVYSLLYQGADLAGNVAACTTSVTVAHDQGK